MLIPNSFKADSSNLLMYLLSIKPIQANFSTFPLEPETSSYRSLSLLARQFNSVIIDFRGIFLAFKNIKRWASKSAPSSVTLFLEEMSSNTSYWIFRAEKCSFYCILRLYPDPVVFFSKICCCKEPKVSIWLMLSPSKQDWASRWQNLWELSSTTIFRQSLSQSSRISITFWVLPDYSPFWINLFNFLEYL